MLCITDDYAGMNVKHAQFASKYVDHGCLLDCFREHLLPSIGKVFKQARTFAHAISFVARFQYFLHPHLNRTPQTYEASGKLVQTGDYPAFAACETPSLNLKMDFYQTLTPFNGLKG